VKNIIEPTLIGAGSPLGQPSDAPHTYVDAGQGHSHIAVRMTITGTLGRHYSDFVTGRAEWLSLAGWVESPSDSQAIVVAAGPEALVGALEMACMLGPMDTLVHALDLEDENEPIAAGFVVRR